MLLAVDSVPAHVQLGPQAIPNRNHPHLARLGFRRRQDKPPSRVLLVVSDLRPLHRQESPDAAPCRERSHEHCAEMGIGMIEKTLLFVVFLPCRIKSPRARKLDAPVNLHDCDRSSLERRIQKKALGDSPIKEMAHSWSSRLMPVSPPLAPGRLRPAANSAHRQARTASMSAFVMASMAFSSSFIVVPCPAGTRPVARAR